jgi:hypothetical protein
MSSFNPFKPLGTLHGGRTKKPFKFFWNTENHYVYIERSGFFGSSKERTNHLTSSWEMAYHAAEAYVHDK